MHIIINKSLITHHSQSIAYELLLLIFILSNSQPKRTMANQHQQRRQAYAQYGPSDLGWLRPHRIFDRFKATNRGLLVDVTREPEKTGPADSAALQGILKELHHFERGSSQDRKVECCIIIILVVLLVLLDVVVARFKVVVQSDGGVVAPIKRSMGYA